MEGSSEDEKKLISQICQEFEWVGGVDLGKAGSREKGQPQQRAGVESNELPDLGSQGGEGVLTDLCRLLETALARRRPRGVRERTDSKACLGSV